ncbi:GntP family permease [Pedobacter sp. BS3]|uniref:GntP family permease n=1 Tax=Pedobacter sp. BS3 TaxID=2567937 RepID=UPI0011EBEB27|nr:GntP family permease [Pedobacter sp. BS3]TZF83170.1 GntP family permease [Pedobacter sp. BS3]
MTFNFLYLLCCLLAGIGIIVLLTTRYRITAFFALIIASFVVGLGMGMPLAGVLQTVKDGFGNILKSLALIIILGTVLGTLLEYTGSTRVMASYILRKVGERRSALAMSLTGFIVGLPIFCDSGYIVLSGLNNSLAKRTGISIAVMAVSLATGLYAIHCMIPPHPGAAAAAGIIQVDVGRLVLFGIVVAVPAMIAGHLWANYAGKKANVIADDTNHIEVTDNQSGPSVIRAFMPILIPILLIAIKSFFTVDPLVTGKWIQVVLMAGDPVIALTIGILLAFNSKRGWKKDTVSKLLHDGVEKAGSILLIIGSGGAFGAVLAAAKIGEQFSEALPLASLGLLFPFLITFIIKTAQGSSTVAIITAASIVLPLLPALGMDNERGHLLSVLAMGAGSMMISHANDAYFWVIAKFSGLDMRTMLRVYSTATLVMGLTSLLVVYVLSLLL